MKLFLDTSVLLSAAGSERGASRWIVREARAIGWHLVSARYCQAETIKNLPKLGTSAAAEYEWIGQAVDWEVDTWVGEFPLLYPKAKDRPVVLAALKAKADYLLTLDRQDFHGLLGAQVYRVSIRTPGDFLLEMRSQGAI